MATVITDNKNCYSYYDHDLMIMHSQFKGIFNYELFKEHTLNVIRFNGSNQILGGLIDFRKLRGSFFKILEHLEKEVQPKLQAQGFNIQAFVVSDDLLTANVTEKLTEKFRSHKGNVKMFTDIDQANKWLLEMINS